MTPKLPKDVIAHHKRMVALRRDLHAHPEIAHQEHGTAERVVAYLEGAGLDLRTGVGGTGVVATAAGEGPRTVLLRVDLDALPVQERSDAPYASRVPGVMHACGHDGHAAMGATAARVLAGRALPG